MLNWSHSQDDFLLIDYDFIFFGFKMKNSSFQTSKLLHKILQSTTSSISDKKELVNLAKIISMREYLLTEHSMNVELGGRSSFNFESFDVFLNEFLKREDVRDFLSPNSQQKSSNERAFLIEKALEPYFLINFPTLCQKSAAWNIILDSGVRFYKWAQVISQKNEELSEEETDSLEKIQTLWKTVEPKLLQKFATKPQGSRVLTNFLNHGQMDEAKTWIDAGAKISSDDKIQKKLQHEILFGRDFELTGWRNKNLSSLTELAGRRANIYELAVTCGLKKPDASFFPLGFVSYLQAGVLTLLQPYFRPIMTSAISVKHWIGLDTYGWDKSYAPSKKKPLEWIRTQGLDEETLKEGLQLFFNQFSEHLQENSHLCYLKNKKLDRLIDLAYQHNIQLDNINNQDERLVSFAITHGASVESLDKLLKMKAIFYSPNTGPCILERMFDPKKPKSLDLIQKVLDLAVQRHGIGALQAIIETKKEGVNLLHLAGRALNVEAMEYFLNQGLDVNAKDDQGNTPFHYIARRYAAGTEKRVTEMVELLHRHGLDWNVKNKTDKTGLMVMSKNGKLDNILQVIKLEPSLFSAQDKEGKTLMDWVSNREEDDITLIGREGLNLSVGGEGVRGSTPKKRI